MELNKEECIIFVTSILQQSKMFSNFHQRKVAIAIEEYFLQVEMWKGLQEKDNVSNSSSLKMMRQEQDVFYKTFLAWVTETEEAAEEAAEEDLINSVRYIPYTSWDNGVFWIEQSYFGRDYPNVNDAYNDGAFEVSKDREANNLFKQVGALSYAQIDNFR